MLSYNSLAYRRQKFVQGVGNMSDPAVLNEVSADRIRAHIEKIVREIPHRAAGSANGKRMAEYSRDAMKSNGLSDVVIHELPAIVSFPEHAEFRVEQPTE